MHRKLKTWKGFIKTYFHDQDVPYDMYYYATYTNKVKTTILRYMLNSGNTPMQKANNLAC